MAGSGGPDTAMMVTRLNPDGSNDNSFDGDGTSGLDLGAVESANAVALQPDGKVVVAGSTGARVAIGRLQPGGSPDTTFDFDGRRTVGFGVSDVGSGWRCSRTEGSSSRARPTATSRSRAWRGDPPPAGGGAGSDPGGGSAGGRAVPPLCGEAGDDRRHLAARRTRGTRRPDVIVALGGTTWSGRERATTWSAGAAGRDRLLGQKGADRLLGQGGRDRLLGGPGADVLGGGAARDACLGGGGRDRAACETRRGL